MTEFEASIRYIEGDDVLDWIKQPGSHTFRYKSNVAGFYFLGVMGSLSAAFAIWTLVRTKLLLLHNWVFFGASAIFAIWCAWTVLHWGMFAVRSYVGISSESLLIGRGHRAYLVPTSRLNKETMDVGEMQSGKYTMVLPLKVDHLKTKVHLVGPFAVLEHLPSFTGEVLTYLLSADELQALAAMDDANIETVESVNAGLADGEVLEFDADTSDESDETTEGSP